MQHESAGNRNDGVLKLKKDGHVAGSGPLVAGIEFAGMLPVAAVPRVQTAVAEGTGLITSNLL